MKLISAQGLVKNFHGRPVIKGIDFDIEQGEVLALIGPNGVGKSTAIAMILGILPPDDGSIAYWRPDYRSFVGAQLQSTPFFEGYSAAENLKLFGALYHTRLSREQIQEKLESCHLADAGKTPAIKLSLGQQKRLAIGVTIVHHPELVVLDEPTAGLDPRARYEIKEMIQTMAQNSQTVLFSSHDMDEVEQIADRLIFMNDGRIVDAGKPETLMAKHGVGNLEALYLKLTPSQFKGGLQ
ncbi:ABC transporter ATP-binding protein [Acetobacterium bakii]|uniref:ABC transporter n=1 Tax=Acetobacterium bakii TaxID=52689 RepID=A0A0L6TYG7_9FIRM|nr:ABC transporter ATP-binding protein [Acetobacterium bakii]KNZ41301.1 ABC transporter [Acetobacterium bakii]